jgi:hypothetical protein
VEVCDLTWWLEVEGFLVDGIKFGVECGLAGVVQASTYPSKLPVKWRTSVAEILY